MGRADALEMDGSGSAEVRLPVPEKRLFKWNVAMGVFHTMFAIIVLAAGKVDLRVPIYGSQTGIEVLANKTQDDNQGWRTVPELPERVGWLYITVLSALFFLLSAFAHFGAASLWKRQYLAALAQGYAPFRWIEYSMSASVMILVLAYISGTVFRSTLVLLFGLTLITMFFGHLHEVICRPLSLEQWSGESKLWRLQAHFLGYVPQCFAWGLVISQFLSGATSTTTDSYVTHTHPETPPQSADTTTAMTTIPPTTRQRHEASAQWSFSGISIMVFQPAAANSYGEENKMPNFVYGIVFAEVIIFWSFGAVQLIVSIRPPSRYAEGEIMYMWLSLFAKGYLGLMLLTNVLMASSFSDIYDDDADVA